MRNRSRDADPEPPGFADFAAARYPALVDLGALLSGDAHHGEDLAQLGLSRNHPLIEGKKRLPRSAARVFHLHNGTTRPWPVVDTCGDRTGRQITSTTGTNPNVASAGTADVG